jgi:hypothetical protein
MARYLTAVLVSICILAPATLKAEDHDARQGRAHEWSERESKPWHDYLKERHKKDHDWTKAKKREQKDYWKWRDRHPD